MINRQVSSAASVQSATAAATRDTGYFPPTTESQEALNSHVSDFTLDWTIFGHQKHESQSIPSGFRTVTSRSTHQGYGEEMSDLAISGSNSTSPAMDVGGYKIKIDVNRLISKLAARARCIGPGPGIRLEDVDEAIRAAVL